MGSPKGNKKQLDTEYDFASDALNAFHPIIVEFEYAVVASGDSYVRWNSENASIEIEYDRRRSFEVGIGFSRQRLGVLLTRTPFNLGEVYREFGVPDASDVSFLQSSDYSRVLQFLKSSCEILHARCQTLLAGSNDAFSALEKRRAQEAEAYTQEIVLAGIRQQADRAWRDHRYEDFVKLLGEEEHSLTPSELSKLDYARKKSRVDR